MKKITRIFVYLQQKIHEIPYEEAHDGLEHNEFVIVNLPDIGEDIARVKLVNIKQAAEATSDDIKIMRKATEEDLQKMQENEEKAREEFQLLRKKAQEYKKEMSPVSAHISLNGSLFYATFTAPERVDFRDLVKDLSLQIGRRIFFEQIGVRDRARILGDLGKCGQKRCCRRFLDIIPSVSMESVRVQNLSSQQLENITGVCCKLKCCLNYEADNYREKRKALPKIRKKVIFEGRSGRVAGIDILNEKVKIQLDDTGEFLTAEAAKLSYPIEK